MSSARHVLAGRLRAAISGGPVNGVADDDRPMLIALAERLAGDDHQLAPLDAHDLEVVATVLRRVALVELHRLGPTDARVEPALVLPRAPADDKPVHLGANGSPPLGLDRCEPMEDCSRADPDAEQRPRNEPVAVPLADPITESATEPTTEPAEPVTEWLAAGDESLLDFPPPQGLPVVPLEAKTAPGEEAEAFAARRTRAAEPLVARAPLPKRMLIGPALAGCMVVGLSLVLFVGYAWIGTRVVEGRAQRVRRAAFDATAKSPPPEGTPTPVVADLVVTKLGIDTIVSEGTSRTSLTGGPAFAPPAVSSPQPPAVVIVGHRTTYGGPFHRLSALQPGDAVSVRTTTGVLAEYRVEQVNRVGPHSAVIAPDGQQRLYLVTADAGVVGSKRLVVVAKRVDAGAALVADAPPPVPLPSGSSGGGSLIGGVLLLTVLFFAAATRSLYSRLWPRAARAGAWLVVGVFAVAGWLVLLGTIGTTA